MTSCSSNPGIELGRQGRELETYLKKISLRIENKTWLKRIRKVLMDFLEYCNGKITKEKTFDYLLKIKSINNTETFRKKLFQIRKFLKYLGMEWANEIMPPPQPQYTPQRITTTDIISTIEHFKNNPYFIQIKALILLGATSGLRAEEIYQLTLEDIDLENRIVFVRHNPKEGKTTKTGKSRITFFSNEAKEALADYLQFFNNSNLKKLFSQKHIGRLFINAPIRVKDLRKYFSQEWERRNGSYGVKEILLGHSLKKSVDLQHYTYLDENDLKAVYDKVMGDLEILPKQYLIYQG